MKSPAVSIKVHLRPRVPVVDKVWVEERIEKTPPECIEAHRFLGLGVPEKIPVQYLVWEEKAGEKRTVSPEGVLEKTQALIHTTGGPDSFLVALYTECGPLFREKVMRVPDALRHLFLALLLKVARDYLSPRGTPPQVAVLEKWLPVDEKEGRYTWWPVAVRKASGGGFCVRPVLVQARKGDWPVFLPPKKPLETREATVAYAEGELVRNAVDYLRRIPLKFTLSRGEIYWQPVALYDACLLWLLLGRRGKTGRKRLSTEVKQKVLARYRTWKNRGKITAAQYEEVKLAVNQAWKEGIRDRGELEEVVEGLLEGTEGLLP